MVGLTLLFGSLPGPWLTLGLPAGLLFALLDRRIAARLAGVLVSAFVSALMLGTEIGGALLAVATAVVLVSSVVLIRGERPLGMDTIVAPALTTAGAGLTLVLLVARGAAARWESALAGGVAEGGRRAIAQYRALGVGAESLAMLEQLTRDVAVALVAVWPALAGLALWLGAWLGHRLLGRWGRVSAPLARRLTPRPFERFRAPEAMVWPLILALVGFWVDAPAVHRAAVNVALALGVVYALTGVALSWWWLGRRGTGVIARVFLVGLGAVFLTPFAAAAWVSLGLADVWLGVRERGSDSRDS